MVQRKFHHWRKFNLRIKGQMWTSWCCHFVEIHPIAAVMDVRILCHPINRLIGLLSAPAAASFQLLKTPITSIWADNFQSLLPGLLGFVSTLMTPWWRKTSHWRFMEFDWRSRQETSRRERSRERGRASHSCRDGGGWERYLHGSKGQERDFNSLPVSAAGMTNSSLCPLEFTSIPPSHSHSFLPLSCLQLLLTQLTVHLPIQIFVVFVGSWLKAVLVLAHNSVCFLKSQILCYHSTKTRISGGPSSGSCQYGQLNLLVTIFV